MRDVTDVEDIYAEEVHQDELTHCDEKDGKIIDVYHFQKELTRNHGIPFKFLIKPVS